MRIVCGLDVRKDSIFIDVIVIPKNIESGKENWRKTDILWILSRLRVTLPP